MKLILSIYALGLLTFNCIENKIIDTSSQHCNHGISKPKHGDFSLFVFCDDALGTQIGVILDKKGVGSAESNGKWSVDDRFWQDKSSMVDVKQYVWSESGNFLYVATSDIYGDNSLYMIDLLNRENIKLVAGDDVNEPIVIDQIKGDKIHANGKYFHFKK